MKSFWVNASFKRSRFDSTRWSSWVLATLPVEISNSFGGNCRKRNEVTKSLSLVITMRESLAATIKISSSGVRLPLGKSKVWIASCPEADNWMARRRGSWASIRNFTGRLAQFFAHDWAVRHTRRLPEGRPPLNRNNQPWFVDESFHYWEALEQIRRDIAIPEYRVYRGKSMDLLWYEPRDLVQSWKDYTVSIMVLPSSLTVTFCLGVLHTVCNRSGKSFLEKVISNWKLEFDSSALLIMREMVCVSETEVTVCVFVR